MPESRSSESEPVQDNPATATFLRGVLEELKKSPARTISSYIVILATLCSATAVVFSYVAARTTVFGVLCLAIGVSLFVLITPCVVLGRDRFLRRRQPREFWFYVLLSNVLMAPVQLLMSKVPVPQSAIDGLREMPYWVGPAIITVDVVFTLFSVMIVALELSEARAKTVFLQDMLKRVVDVVGRSVEHQGQMLGHLADVAGAVRQVEERKGSEIGTAVDHIAGGPSDTSGQLLAGKMQAENPLVIETRVPRQPAPSARRRRGAGEGG